MQEIAQALINAVFQVVLLTTIPYLYYTLKHHKSRGYFAWLGVCLPQGRTMGLAVLFAVAGMAVWAMAFSLPGLRAVAVAPNTVAGQLSESGFGPVTLVVMLIQVFLQTALSEEIFFRGFLSQRLIAGHGFAVGNALQAVVFGLIHLNLFFASGGPAFSLLTAIPVVLLTAAFGWGMGFLNERLGNGSIAPSWLAHGLSNLAAFSLLAFML